MEGAVDFKFAPGTVIPANSSFYVSPDVRAFRARTVSPRGREGHFVLGPYSGHLSARGEAIEVRNTASNIVNSFSYEGAPTLAQQFLRVTEIMYHPLATPGNPTSSEEYEFIELKNISTNITLPLAGVQFTNGIFFNFSSSGVTNLAPGAHVLVVKNAAAFMDRYGSGLPIAGQYTGALDNSGERIRIIDSTGEEVLDFRYNNSWYPTTNGSGSSLVIVDESAPPDSWSDSVNWRASLEPNGTPGTGSASAQPRVSVEHAGNVLRISWTGADPGWRLESSDELGARTVWVPVAGVPAGAQSIEVVPGAQRSWYRLARP